MDNKNPAPLPALQPWRLLASEDVLRERWCTLRRERYALANGRIVEPYYVIEDYDWTHVFAIRDDGRIGVVRQYRPAAEVFCLELPGGIVDPGEDPLAAAQRELREELGATARAWTTLRVTYPNPARQTNRVHLFVATGVTSDGIQTLDPNEEVTPLFLTEQEIRDAIRTGEFTQGLHIASFFVALDHLRALATTPPPTAAEAPQS